MIMDHTQNEWWRKWQDALRTGVDPGPFPSTKGPPVTQEEIDEFRRLLERAREYDKRNNEPDCEMESKKQKLRDLAKELGIEDKIQFIDGEK
jgi:hypothetical protein